jgi:hypothetical protein
MSSLADSVSGHSLVRDTGRFAIRADMEKAFDVAATPCDNSARASPDLPEKENSSNKHQVKRHRFDEKVDVESAYDEEKRPTMLYAPIYNGLAAGLATVFVGSGISEYFDFISSHPLYDPSQRSSCKNIY